MATSTSTSTDRTGLDDLDPGTVRSRDATHFRAIIAANDALGAADRGLRAAVRDAREAGETWTVIGAALGISKQAAQQRFSS